MTQRMCDWDMVTGRHRRSEKIPKATERVPEDDHRMPPAVPEPTLPYGSSKGLPKGLQHPWTYSETLP